MRSLLGSLALVVILGGGGLAAYKYCKPVQEYVQSAHMAS
jgi:hypothetical protein